MKLNLRWLFRDLVNQIWFTVALYCLLGILVALGAVLFKRFIPESFSSSIGADAVDRMLGIIDASMLAVATFSLSTMVQAFVSAGSGATPRAAQLVVEDRAAHQALATFIGAFVFSLVGLAALSTGIYGSSGRLLLFVATVGVIVLIVVTLLRWIQRLSKLGRVVETIDQVEQVTRRAIEERCQNPCLGAQLLLDASSLRVPVLARSVGYVRRVDVAKLDAIAEEVGQDIYVEAAPGSFMTLDRALVVLDVDVEEAVRDRIAGCFMVGDQRSFEQDPRFGFVVLSEIASRALSPAVNDPGTAIDVIGTMVRLLSVWTEGRVGPSPPAEYQRVHMRPISPHALLNDAIVPIARDGAALVEVGIRLQKGLKALTRLGDWDLAEAARAQAHDARTRADAALTFAGDRERIAAAARLDG